MKLKHALLAVIMLGIFTIPASAVNFIVGAKSGYSVWKPYFREIPFLANLDSGSGILYGPVFSISFAEDFTFSLAGQFGTQRAQGTNDFSTVPSDSTKESQATFIWDSDRYDVDTALSYRITSWLKVFAGYKIQYVDSTSRNTELRSIKSDHNLTDAYHEKLNIESLTHGPAIGVGFAYVFGKGFFGALNTSFVAMFGTFEADIIFQNKFFGTNFPMVPETNLFSMNVDSIQLGVNIEPSIGYRSELGIMITLGFRFQWLSSRLQDVPAEAEFLKKTLDDYVYGAIVSIMYAF
ncbi:hypothetical protein ACFL20_10135 [Spirochaetota bacterium]